jgi:hypothetical protein
MATWATGKAMRIPRRNARNRGPTCVNVGGMMEWRLLANPRHVTFVVSRSCGAEKYRICPRLGDVTAKQRQQPSLARATGWDCLRNRTGSESAGIHMLKTSDTWAIARCSSLELRAEALAQLTEGFHSRALVSPERRNARIAARTMAARWDKT